MSYQNENQSPVVGPWNSCRKANDSKPISWTPIYVDFLQQAVHSSGLLQKSGFTLAPLTSQELTAKDRCKRCHTRIGGKHRKHNRAKLSDTSEPRPSVQGEAKIPDDAVESRDNRKPTFLCKYHPGHVYNKKWTCCNSHPVSPPCQGEPSHLPAKTSLNRLSRRHQFHFTPAAPSAAYGSSGAKHRQVVALDCEMGTAFDNETELIRVTLVDYFTAEVLVDSLVWPDVPMASLNTRYSGIGWGTLKAARKEGRCVAGVAAARRAVWEYVSPGTIVVGHSVHCDLNVLRWIHPVVVDSLLLAKAAKGAASSNSGGDDGQDGDEDGDGVSRNGTSVLESDEETPGSGGVRLDKKEPSGAKKKKNKRKRGGDFSLKKLAMEKLGRAIQGRRGHDSLEDALAARDLVHGYISKEIHSLEEVWH